MPLTKSKKTFGYEEVVVGMPIDLAELDSSHIKGRGVIVYLPMIRGSHSSSEQFNAFQLSQNYKEAKFVVLLARLPTSYSKDEERSIANRNDNYRKLIEDLSNKSKLHPPIFISKNSIELENFQPFFHKLNLQKML